MPLRNPSLWPFSTDPDTLWCVVMGFVVFLVPHGINNTDDLGAPSHSCNQNEVFRCYDNKNINLLNGADPCHYHYRKNVLYFFICDYQVFVRLIAVSLFRTAVSV